jgi:HEAT repeat protein
LSADTPPSNSDASDRPAPEEEPRQTTPFLVLQFFVFPLAIVAVCVAVFVIFGLIAGESRGARDYLAEVRGGSANRRWQAAFELSKVLQARKDPALSDPHFAEEAVRLFRESGTDDPRVRRYLALALGRLGDPRAVPALLEAVEEGADKEGPVDAEIQIYAVWALGAIGDGAALPKLVALAGGADPALRKAAVYALGAFPGDVAQAALVKALGDATEDVRWNAAVALARRREARAAPVLLEMMDRTHLADLDRRLRERGLPEGLTPEQREEAILQAVAAAAALPTPALQTALEGLRDGDENLKVREAARRALARP